MKIKTLMLATMLASAVVFAAPAAKAAAPAAKAAPAAEEAEELEEIEDYETPLAGPAMEAEDELIEVDESEILPEDIEEFVVVEDGEVPLPMPEDVEAEEAAEETPQIEYSYDELTVAATTPRTGQFFTSMWGNGSSDMDVRAMIHGYNLVEWDTEAGVFLPDSSVITGSAVTQEANGDITFILMLYEDLYYSDGTPITAWDYAVSMLLTMAPELKELGANVRTPDYIAGYNNYITGRTKALSGVKVTGDHILNITINGNYLPFFYELGLLDCIPYPISVIAPG